MQVTPTIHSDPQVRLDESLVTQTRLTLQPRASSSLRLRIPPTCAPPSQQGWGCGGPYPDLDQVQGWQWWLSRALDRACEN
jgi:hypothetical protein